MNWIIRSTRYPKAYEISTSSAVAQHVQVSVQRRERPGSEDTMPLIDRLLEISQKWHARTGASWEWRTYSRYDAAKKRSYFVSCPKEVQAN
jgi:hypothetical protein